MSHKLKNIPFTLTIGVELKAFASLKLTFNSKIASFDCLLVPLVHPLQYRTDCSRPFPLTYSGNYFFCHCVDCTLKASEWQRLVGKTSENFIFPDSTHASIRKTSEFIFEQELQLAVHYGFGRVLLPPPSYNCANYAHILSKCLKKHMVYYVPCKLTSESWESYQLLKKLCGYDAAIKICLEIEENIEQSKEEISQWKCEQLGMIRMKTSVFVTDDKGKPILSVAHQEIIKELFPYCSRIVLRGKHPHDNLDPYKNSIFWLFASQKAYTENDVLDYTYKDYLQSPLQPLMTNLEAASYETFENDEAKYLCYQNALVLALKDFKEFGHFKHSKTFIENSSNMIVEGKPVKILLVGAGRGPLIRRAFCASADTGVSIHVTAVEKNPNAIVTLRNLVFNEPWGKYLTVVKGDIREWDTTERFDIIMSELLGSFGDNELSPECLDGAQKLLSTSGIFIPSQYTSYLHPVNSSKLWVEVKNTPGVHSYEIPYVVKIYSATFIGDPKPAASFSHPNVEKLENSRYVELVFENTNDFPTYVHGFAGYFDAILYGELHMSIVPETHTKDLHSWFPIYFPLKEPLLVEPSDLVEVRLWRDGNGLKVWYEWVIGVRSKTGAYRTTYIHNAKGRAYSIGLY